MHHVPCVLLESVSREEILDERGNRTVELFAVPRQGDLVAFAGKAWRVREVWHVHNGAARLLVTAADLPAVGGLSYR
jgi:hypothetical protein